MAGDFNIGSDTTVTIVSNGQFLNSQRLTSFHMQQIAPQIKSAAINGENSYRHIEEGWQGDLRYDRADSVLDDYFAAKEAARYVFGSRPPVAFITEVTANVDGSQSVYRYDGLTMTLADGGNRSGDAKVDVHVSWTAARRIKVQ